MSGSDPVCAPLRFEQVDEAALCHLMKCAVKTHASMNEVQRLRERRRRLADAQYELRFESDNRLCESFNASIAALDAEVNSGTVMLGQHRKELLAAGAAVGQAGMNLLRLMMVPALQEGSKRRCPSCKLLLEQSGPHLVECV